MKTLRCLPILAAVLLLSSAPAARAEDDERCANGQYLLETSEAPALQRKAVALLENATGKDFTVATTTGSAVLVQLPDAPAENHVDADQANAACRKLERQRRAALRAGDGLVNGILPRRVGCSCNYVVKASASYPNDPSFGALWGLHANDDIDMDLPEAWSHTTGSDEIVIAVIDTGVDYNHPDLKDNIWVNPGEIAGNGIDDDQNGVIDDIHGARFTYPDVTGDPMDDHGHGTHVSGTIGARGNNGIGITGVNQRIKIMGVKFLRSEGRGYNSDATLAVNYVNKMRREKGINIILTNNSWGGGGYVQALEEAIQKHNDPGENGRQAMLFVAAAGNSAINIDTTGYYPARYASDNIIPVAAVAQGGALASFSCYGPQTVPIAAPGVAIYSTYFGSYVYMKGTSMATPHVSGALGLLAGYAPHLLAWELKQILLESATTLPSLVGRVHGARFVNANNMLLRSADYPPDQVRPTPVPGYPTPLPTATFTPTITPTPSVTPTPTKTPHPGPYDFSGKAFHQYGTVLKPVAGVLVRLQFNGVTLTRTTDSSGSYLFSKSIPSPTNYALSGSADGLIFGSMSGRIDTDLTIPLYSVPIPPSVLSGRVITAGNLPLADVNVSAGPFGERLTDGQGFFSFEVPYGLDYRLSATVGGYTIDTTLGRGTMYGDVERTFVAVPE